MLLLLTIIGFLTISSCWSEIFSNNHPKNLSQAIIVGVKKCGTRALLKFLSIHPAIAVASTELHFFDSYTNFQHGLQWYRAQIPINRSSQHIIIEKTPSYFINKSTPLRIARLLPDAQLIIIIRDPITRAISDYVQLRNRHRFYPSFDDWISSSNFTQRTPVKIGCYAQYLRRWLKYFPRNQMHFVDGENLIHRPWEELEHVQTFLNLPVRIHREDFYFNPNKYGFPCLRQTNGCLGLNKGRRHPVIANQTRNKLNDFYLTCNAELKRLAQIDFSWI
ncbi:unnamed protein product [Adineta ricciae]|uniref:Sulfotransferase domain-containing protein n=1 Tax=Adineta ricciae TaxID=249248 RepID=A0A814E925_ADIRI|nr:unnamed protein product [Adineta ricciae]CAF0964790.1 unnamed protein product [Adineta ricciae]